MTLLKTMKMDKSHYNIETLRYYANTIQRLGLRSYQFCGNMLEYLHNNNFLTFDEFIENYNSDIRNIDELKADATNRISTLSESDKVKENILKYAINLIFVDSWNGYMYEKTAENTLNDMIQDLNDGLGTRVYELRHATKEQDYVEGIDYIIYDIQKDKVFKLLQVKPIKYKYYSGIGTYEYEKAYKQSLSAKQKYGTPIFTIYVTNDYEIENYSDLDLHIIF